MREEGVYTTFPCPGAWKGCTRWAGIGTQERGLESTQDKSQQQGSVPSDWGVPVAFLSWGWGGRSSRHG